MCWTYPSPNISPCHRLEPQRKWKDYGTPDICHVAQWHRSSHNLMDVIGWRILENFRHTTRDAGKKTWWWQCWWWWWWWKLNFLSSGPNHAKKKQTHQVNTHTQTHKKKTCWQTELGRMTRYKLNKKLIPSNHRIVSWDVLDRNHVDGLLQNARSLPTGKLARRWAPPSYKCLINGYLRL